MLARLAFTIAVLLILVGTLFAQDAPAKAPVPDSTAQERATALVRELYKEKFDAATTVQQKQALAVELVDKAKAVRSDIPTHYVLLKEAGSLSVKAGDVKTAFLVIDEMSQTFQIDATKMKLAVVNAVQATWKTEGQESERKAVETEGMVYRVKLELSEYGDGTFRMERVPSSTKETFSGKPLKLTRFPNAIARKATNEVCQIVHDFTRPDSLEQLGTARLVRLNDNALVFTPGRSDPKAAHFLYCRRLGLPITIVCDVKDFGDGDFAIRFTEFPPSVGVLSCNVRKLKSNPAEVQIQWYELEQNRKTYKKTPNTLVEFKQDQPLDRQFRLPLPTRQIPNMFFFELLRTEGREPTVVSRLEVRGHFPALFGLHLDERDSNIFVRRTLPNSVAEKAGFQSGDILVTVNGHQRKSLKEMMDLLANLPLGEEVVFMIERRGSKQEIRVVAE